ncbi:polysaccharide deacetylase family protein [Proteinivorax hydrogeniformans]|uniref:Polysaccharide deacetylase family protein n=1 Tax=Proteinivorax hydrogeniformans TaxID=1826727 RepID=A0AAU8HWK1_9FIRM
MNIQRMFSVLLLALIATSLLYNFSKEGAEMVTNQQRQLPIYRVGTDKPQVAISFDAAWGADYTEEILDVLDEYEIKTTFFLVGFWVDEYPEMVKEIHKRGHEIGNHSTTHPEMSKLTSEQVKEELLITEEKIFELTGQKATVFRPPFGDYNDNLINSAKEVGYHTIQWDVDSLDWKERGVMDIVERIKAKSSEGSIILFHNNGKYTAEALPLVLDYLTKEKSLDVVPISELIYKQNYHIDHQGEQNLN